MYGNQVEASTAGGTGSIRPQTLTERLSHEKANLETRLKEINSVLKHLESNPDVQYILDAVARLGHMNY